MGDGPAGSAATEQAEQAAPAEPSRSRELASLLEEVDAFGDGAQERLDQRVRAFFSANDAVPLLARTFDELPARNRGARWKIVYLAGQARSPAAVQFLERVALSAPEPRLESAPDDEHAHDKGTDGHEVRLTAAIGLVHAHAAKVTGATESVGRVLANADAEVSRMAALELFSQGALTGAWENVVKQRGISTRFRRLTDAELEQLRTVTPEELSRPGQLPKQPKQHSAPPQVTSSKGTDQ